MDDERSERLERKRKARRARVGRREHRELREGGFDHHMDFWTRHGNPIAGVIFGLITWPLRLIVSAATGPSQRALDEDAFEEAQRTRQRLRRKQLARDEDEAVDE